MLSQRTQMLLVLGVMLLIASAGVTSQGPGTPKPLPPDSARLVKVATPLSGIIAVLGVEIHKGTDGRSLRPLFEEKSEGWRGHWFYEHHFHARGSKEGAIPRTEGVRTADWKYITYIDEKELYEELYDLKNDPFEERNLAADSKHAAKLREMKAIYTDYVKKLPPAVLPREKKK